MDSKKVLQKLLKIAENQQKIIMKLAQGLPPDSLSNSQVTLSDSQKPSTQPPPDDLNPGGSSRTPSKALYDALDPRVKANVRHVNPPSQGKLEVLFNKGQMNANWSAVQKTYQDLLNRNIIFQNYQLTGREV